MIKSYDQRAGENLQRIFSGLKRRREDAARELGYSLDEITSMIRGEAGIPHELAEKASQIWPVNVRDFYLIADDAIRDGIILMRAEDSKTSARIMDRGGAPFYEYRDTAMTSLAPFRPEWISELCVVDDNDPENLKVQWNNGHFEQQFTYFIGEVNFYYIDNSGHKQVAVMNTGDSMHLSPFVPHTFTSRNPDNLGLILALTYGDKLWGDAQLELSALGDESASAYGYDFSNRDMAFASILNSYMRARSIDVRTLIARSGLSTELVHQLLEGKHSIIPSSDYGLFNMVSKLAGALNVNRRDLMPPDTIEERVIIKLHKEAQSRIYPEDANLQVKTYKVVDLASPMSLPHSSGLEFTLLKNENPEQYDLTVPRHQYIYNIGQRSVNINWRSNGEDHVDVISPDDSLYMKPNIPHNFRGRGGQLVVLRIGGRIAGEPERELSLIEQENRHRVVAEPNPWYNKEGKH